MDEVRGTSAVVDRLQMDSVYVLRVRGCNKAGFGEYSEEVYLHTPPASGEICTWIIFFIFHSLQTILHLSILLKTNEVTLCIQCGFIESVYL